MRCWHSWAPYRRPVLRPLGHCTRDPVGSETCFGIIDRSHQLDEQIGETNVFGNGFDQLDGPYTAFVIGDYTGQTPPPEDF